jgi:hypothetical protein
LVRARSSVLHVLPGLPSIPHQRADRESDYLKESKTTRNEVPPRPNLVTGTVELIVTPEMRAAIKRKRSKRHKARLLAERVGLGFSL